MSSFKALCKFDFVLEYICHFMLAERTVAGRISGAVLSRRLRAATWLCARR